MITLVFLPLSSKEAVRQRPHHGRRTRRCPPTPQNEPRFLHNTVSVLPKFSFHFRKKKKCPAAYETTEVVEIAERPLPPTHLYFSC